MIGQIILQLILIALNAIFACAEIAVLSINENKLLRLEEQGDKKAKRINKLKSQPAKFLATIQVAITLSGFLGSAFAADNFSGVIVDGLMSMGLAVPKETLETISVVAITIILSFVTLVFGELVPKRLAMRKAESLGLALSGIVSFISKAFAPLVWLLTASTNGILRLFRIDPDGDEDEISEEDIRMMAITGSKKGIIEEEENFLIQNIFEFNDISVDEIMTHRTELVLLNKDDSIEDWKRTIYKNNHIYYPVCDGSSDNIIGILDSRSFFRLDDQSKKNVFKHAIDEPYFVSSFIKADTLFRKMKSAKKYFAVVVDEFGGTDGIITVNDLIEELVGDIEQNNREIVKLDDITYKIESYAELAKVERTLDIDFDSDTLTLGGWLIEKFSYVPKKGKSITYDDYTFTVIESDNKKIIRILAKKTDD